MRKVLKLLGFVLLMIAVLLVGLVVVNKVRSISAKNVDLSTQDFSKCFSGDVERKHSYLDYKNFHERLEYVYSDSKGNNLQNLLIKRMGNSSSEFWRVLTDNRCKYVDCDLIIVDFYPVARVNTKWEIRERKGEAPYMTEYHVSIGDLVIESLGNGYDWSESEDNSISVFKCVLNTLN